MNLNELIRQIQISLAQGAASPELNDALWRAMLSGNSLLVEHHSAIMQLRGTLQHLERIISSGQEKELGFGRFYCSPDSSIKEFLAVCAVGGLAKEKGAPVMLKGIVLLENIGQVSAGLAAFLQPLLRGEPAGYEDGEVRVPALFLAVAEQDRADRESESKLHAALARGFGMRLTMAPPTAKEELRLLCATDGQAPPAERSAEIPSNLRQLISQQVELPTAMAEKVIQFAIQLQEDDRVIPGGRPGQAALGDWLRAARVNAFLRSSPTVEWPDFADTVHRSLDHRLRLQNRTIEKGRKVIEDAMGLPDDFQAKEAGVSQGNALQAAYDNVFLPMSQWLKAKVLGRDRDEDEFSVNTLDLVLLSLFSKGHILLEDFPGSGKSYLAENLGNMIEDDLEEEPIDIVNYNRIQCTPDLLPSDITGYMMLENGAMHFRRGPVFTYVLLLDEINRTTPKVQSALLQAMAERKVSIDDRTYRLSELFFVIATQNPLDKAGTYELPQAQLDRFLFKRQLPLMQDPEIMKKIMMSDFETGPGRSPLKIPSIKATSVIAASNTILNQGQDGKDAVPVPQSVIDLILEIASVINLRCGVKSNKDRDGTDIPPWQMLKQGSQPSVRTLQRLIPALKTLAWIEAKGQSSEVNSSHVRRICCDWLRHRISPANPAEGVKVDDIIKAVFKVACENEQQRHIRKI